MNKYYQGFTEAIKRYQKSDKYKKYRRKYEKSYRQNNRIMVNYLTWRSMTSYVTPQKEMNYLLKRFLGE